VEAPAIIGGFPAYYLFNSLLYILQILHILWFYVILKVAYNSFTGKSVKDDRSESDLSEEDTNSQETTQKKTK
jgi:hypothetical protein